MTQTAIRLDFVAMLADDCSKGDGLVAAASDAAMKAAARAIDPAKCRPGSPAVSNAYDEAARHWLSAAYVTVPPSTTTAERLLVAAIMAARAEGRELILGACDLAELQLTAIEADAIAAAVSFGDSFVTDWVENEGAADPEALAGAGAVELASAVVERIERKLAGKPPAPTRVVVALEGGLVQGAVADRPGVSVTVLDYDTEGADAAEIRAIPQDGGGTAEATIGGHSAAHDPAWIDAAEKAELADPEGAIELLRKRAAKWDREYPTLAAEARIEADEIAAKLAAEEAADQAA